MVIQIDHVEKKNCKHYQSSFHFRNPPNKTQFFFKKSVNQDIKKMLLIVLVERYPMIDNVCQRYKNSS